MPYRAAPPTMATITISVTLHDDRAERGAAGELVDGPLQEARSKRGEDIGDDDEQQPVEIGAAIAPHVGQEAS